MSLTIRTNLSSLIAQNSLKTSTNKLNQAIERMTSGAKINHAKDNAANYSIATNMTTKINAYMVAEDNCAMGLDLVTTAEESLSLIQDKLQRLRDLQEQASNGTYGEDSLKAINAEVNALVDEIERNYKNTEYNGIKLFGETKSAFTNEVTKKDTSSMTSLASVAYDSTITSGTYSISTAEELQKLASITVKGGEFVLANDIDLSAYSSGNGWTPIGGQRQFNGTFDGNGYIVSNLYIKRTGENCQGLFGGNVYGDIKNLGLENADITGFDYSSIIVGACDPAVTVTNCYATGSVKRIGGGVESLVCGYANSVDSYYLSELPEPDDVSFNFQVGINASNNSQISLNTSFSINVTSLRGIGLTQKDYLEEIDKLISATTAKQTEFGAVSNRLESALDEIATQYDNLVSSRSTIQDADIAELSSEYIKMQILQQASATLMATANQSPSIALQLL